MSRQYTNLPQPPPRPIPANRNEPKNSIWTTSGRIGRKDYTISILIGCGMLSRRYGMARKESAESLCRFAVRFNLFYLVYCIDNFYRKKTSRYGLFRILVVPHIIYKFYNIRIRLNYNNNIAVLYSRNKICKQVWRCSP